MFLYTLLALCCCVNAAPLIALNGVDGVTRDLEARSSTFGTILKVPWPSLRLHIANGSACLYDVAASSKITKDILLVLDSQPTTWSKTCSEVTMAARARSLGYAAVLVEDATGTRSEHAMRGFMKDDDDDRPFVAYYVLRSAGDVLRAAGEGANVTLLRNTDDLSAIDAWLSYYVSWTVACAVLNGLLSFTALLLVVYLLLKQRRRRRRRKSSSSSFRLTNAVLSTAMAGASALVLVVFATTASYERARAFLTTPSYAVVADLAEALQVLALILYLECWARVAATLHERITGLVTPRITRIVCILYGLVFLCFTVLRGYVESLWLVPPLLNLSALAILALAFTLFGVSVVREVWRFRERDVSRALVRRTLGFLIVVVVAIYTKLIVIIVALSTRVYIVETYSAILLACDVAIVAAIVVVVLSIVARALLQGSAAAVTTTSSSSAESSTVPRATVARTTREARRTEPTKTPTSQPTQPTTTSQPTTTTSEQSDSMGELPV